MWFRQDGQPILGCLDRLFDEAQRIGVSRQSHSCNARDAPCLGDKSSVKPRGVSAQFTKCCNGLIGVR